MPKPRSAGGTKCAVERVSCIGRTRPEVWLTLQNMERGLRHDERNSECRCGLLLALPAVANIDFNRRMRQLVSDRAALASTEENIAFVRHDRKPFRGQPPRLNYSSRRWISLYLNPQLNVICRCDSVWCRPGFSRGRHRNERFSTRHCGRAGRTLGGALLQRI